MIAKIISIFPPIHKAHRFSESMYSWEGAHLFMGRGASIYGKGRISHDELLLFGEPVLAGFASVDEGGQWEDVGRAGDENEGHGRKNKSDVELREKRRLRVVQC